MHQNASKFSRPLFRVQTSGIVVAMNPYSEYDDVIAPRRKRSPWVLVGQCHPALRACFVNRESVSARLGSAQASSSPAAPGCAGAVVTGGVLMGGLVAFKNNKAALAQQFMRARVIAQGVTVAIMASSGGYLAVEAAQQRAAAAAENSPVPRQ